MSHHMATSSLSSKENHFVTWGLGGFSPGSGATKTCHTMNVWFIYLPFSWFVWQMLVNINKLIINIIYIYGSYGNGLESLESFASSFGNVLTLLLLPPCYHWGHECILMCHVSSFLAIWLVGVLFVCSRYVGSEDWWGDMEVILTCHSTVKGVQRTLPKRLGNLDIVHCYFTGWWFQILLVKRNR